jgi:hypothetical protein
MRNVILTIIAALVALPVFGGCQAEPQAELTPTKKACIEMMQKVPVHYENFEFWDVASLRGDPDLSEMNKVWQERKGDWLANFNISDTSVEYLSESDVMTQATGNFELQDIRDSLAADYSRDNSYENAEVWQAKSGVAPQRMGGAVYLAEKLFVWGNDFNIDDYLKVAIGKELSMYDKNAAEVLERLPEGIETRISRSGYPEGLILSGSSITKEEKNVLRWTNIYKFESAEDAQSADAEKYFQGIEDGFKEAENIFAERGEANLFNTFTIQRDGEFVTWSMLIDEKYMIALLFYGQSGDSYLL